MSFTCTNCGNEFVPVAYEITRIVDDPDRYVVEYRVMVDYPPVVENLHMSLEKGQNVDVGGEVQRVPKEWTKEEVESLLVASIEKKRQEAIDKRNEPVKLTPGPLDNLMGTHGLVVS